MRRSLIVLLMVVVIGAMGALGGASPAAGQEIVIGVQCDRTGATQIVGTVLCPGFHDYIALVNSKGGVEGHKIKDLEIDHEYKVPPAVESYERFKKEGAVSIAVYGTPQIYALAAKLTEDRIPGTSPGFGSAAAADGVRYPYIFPIAATYWSQGTAAVDFVKKQLGGSLKGKKIAYIFFDNPAGREPIQVLEDLAAKEGFQLKTFAVPPPAPVHLARAEQAVMLAGPRQNELAALLDRLFDIRGQNKSAEIRDLEAEIDRLKKALVERQKTKREIVRARLEELLGEKTTPEW